MIVLILSSESSASPNFIVVHRDRWLGSLLLLAGMGILSSAGHTTPHQQLFTSNTLPTAHRNISRRTTDAAHHTGICKYFTDTLQNLHGGGTRRLQNARSDTPQNTSIHFEEYDRGGPNFFVLGRVSAVPFATKIDHDLPGVCHKVFNTSSTRWNYTKGTTCMNDKRYDQYVQSTP